MKNLMVLTATVALLSGNAQAENALNEIACLPGENKKVIVTEGGATVDFVVRGAAGYAENSDSSCWCGESDAVFKQADRLRDLLLSVQSLRGIPAEAIDFLLGNLDENIVRELGLTRDFEFQVDISPGEGLRSKSVACLSDIEIEIYAAQISVFVTELLE